MTLSVLFISYCVACERLAMLQHRARMIYPHSFTKFCQLDWLISCSMTNIIVTQNELTTDWYLYVERRLLILWSFANWNLMDVVAVWAEK